MVMVTHEVNLKNFCDRVIRMVDGKIQRIENIPHQVQVNCIKEL